MTLFTEREIRDRYDRERRSYSIRTRTFSAQTVLNEGRIMDSSKKYDIFLSHSSKDMELIAGLKLMLEDMHFKVYVDWNDNELDPYNISPETAVVLRERMKQCRSLVYAYSENASESKWMPWELGYFDALRNSRVAILPISDTKSGFYGTEFVGIYDYIQKVKYVSETERTICVCKGENYIRFTKWLEGNNPK